MIRIENTEVVGWEPAIRGMRNPMNSWAKSDSYHDKETGKYVLGEKDLELAMKLAKSGPVHAKYRRMIVVYADITAPLYWWKEADTYKVGTVTDSCSTMHKIHAKEFTMDDFSVEHLKKADGCEWGNFVPYNIMEQLISVLNQYRSLYIQTKEKGYWWQMIQLLPSSYNQKRTIMLNYEVLANIYKTRRDHKLDEWREFCKWVECLPYSEIVTGV